MPFMAPLGYVLFIFLCSFLVVCVVFTENNARFVLFCVTLEKCMLLTVSYHFIHFSAISLASPFLCLVL